MPTAALIVNGRSRRGREWFRPAGEALRQAGFELVRETLVRRPEVLKASVRDALAEDIPLVCVGGGDGTLSAVADCFVGRETVMGIIPAGTGNAFAHDLGIPPTVRDSVRIIAGRHSERVDLGEANGQCFVNLATVGLTTLIAANLDPSTKRRFGRAAYLVALFRALPRARRFNARIELPDETLEFRSIQIVVGNGRFHGGPFPVTPDADIRSGTLAGYSVNTSRKGVLVRYALRLWFGRHVDMEEVVPFTAAEVRVETFPSRRITVDGETRWRTPGKFRSIPNAIRVMCPPSSADEPGS